MLEYPLIISRCWHLALWSSMLCVCLQSGVGTWTGFVGIVLDLHLDLLFLRSPCMVRPNLLVGQYTDPLPDTLTLIYTIAHNTQRHTAALLRGHIHINAADTITDSWSGPFSAPVERICSIRPRSSSHRQPSSLVAMEISWCSAMAGGVPWWHHRYFCDLKGTFHSHV